MSELTVRSLAETARYLNQPFALEDIGLSPTPILATSVDGTGTASLDPEQRDHMATMLSSVRAVTVAIADAPIDGATADVAEMFDVVIGPPSQSNGAVALDDIDHGLTQLVDGVRQRPNASVALAELLRHRAYEQVPLGLVLESLTYSTLQSSPEFARWLSDRGAATLPVDAEPPLLVERAESSLHITFNRPTRSNAFTAGMRDGLVEALRTAAADPSIDGVVIDGAGGSFCSGGDLAEFGTAPDPATAHATRVLRSPGWWLHHLSRDVRVHLHGHCVGAGIELPAFAGTVIAAADTRVRLPEVAMGLVPGAGGTVSIPRRIGRHRTAFLAITGITLSATEALAWGLVDRVE